MFDLNEQIADGNANFANKTFLRQKGMALSFGGLLAALNSLAGKLPQLEGRRCLILLPDSINTVLVHLECFRQKATLIPVSPFIAFSQLEYICLAARPHLVFTSTFLFRKNRRVLDQYLCVIVDAGESPDAAFCGAEQALGQSLRENDQTVRSIFFTSGTTGRPKGVCLSEHNILSAAFINSSILKLSEFRKSIITIPLYDYYGMIQIYSHLFSKSKLIIGESGQFQKALLEAVIDFAVTDLVLVPYTLKSIIDYSHRDGKELAWHAFRFISHISTSSDLLHSSIIERTFKLNKLTKIINVYGLTEAGRAAYREIRHDSDFGNSIGKASPHMEIRIDAPGEGPGEIIINGPTAMLGYLAGFDGDRIRFSPVKEIRTADEGYLGEDGEIILMGRKDDLISLFGVKLHPSEIERSVLELPQVTDAVARVRNVNGEKTIAVDVVSTSRDLTSDFIISHLRGSVPRMFLPREINFVDEIARTEIGTKTIRSKK